MYGERPYQFWLQFTHVLQLNTRATRRVAVEEDEVLGFGLNHAVRRHVIVGYLVVQSAHPHHLIHKS